MGIYPENLFPSSLTFLAMLVNCPILPKDDGIAPFKLLFESRRVCKNVMFPIASGRVSLKSFFSKFSSSSAGRPLLESLGNKSDGIAPESVLSLSSNFSY